MATYFDPADVNHKKLIPPGYRGHAELANVAALVEADVIGYFTSNPPYYLYTAFLSYMVSSNDLGQAVGGFTGIWGGYFNERGIGFDITAQGQPSGADVAPLRVYLRGFHSDSANANVDPNLKVALRHTIADVITWRLVQWTAIEPGTDAATTTEAGVPKSKRFKPTAEDAFPPDWNRRLEPFDSRPISWAL